MPDVNLKPQSNRQSHSDGRWTPWWSLLLLALMYIVSFIDRMIMTLLVAPIKIEMGVSDVQIGMLHGTIFALSYAVFGIPAARLADRGNRHWLIFFGVTIWSAMTLASAWARSFPTLLALRIGVAAGEAALTPAAFSLISDLFPVHRRQLAASWYQACAPIGTGLTFIVGAMLLTAVAAHFGGSWQGLSSWRLVLLAVGIPGIPLALLFLLTTREPARGQFDAKSADSVSAKDAWPYFRAYERMYAGLFIGAAAAHFVNLAFQGWTPELLRRAYSWSPAQSGPVLGTTSMAVALCATFAGPYLARMLFRMGRNDAVMLVSLFGLVLGGAFDLIAPMAPTPVIFIALSACGSFLLIAAITNVVVSMQYLAPPRVRATAVALLLLSTSLLGNGLGPLGAAWISDRLSPLGNMLGTALSAIAIIGVVVGSFFLLRGRRMIADAASAVAAKL